MHTTPFPWYPVGLGHSSLFLEQQKFPESIWAYLTSAENDNVWAILNQIWNDARQKQETFSVVLGLILVYEVKENKKYAF